MHECAKTYSTQTSRTNKIMLSVAGMVSISTAPTTNPTSPSATTAAPPHTPFDFPKYSSRQSGTQASSPSQSGPRTAASRSCGPKGMAQDTDTTQTTCSVGRGTRCSGPWTRGATSPGVRNFRRRASLREIRVPRSLLSPRPLTVVSCCIGYCGLAQVLTLLSQGWQLYLAI